MTEFHNACLRFVDSVVQQIFSAGENNYKGSILKHITMKTPQYVCTY